MKMTEDEKWDKILEELKLIHEELDKINTMANKLEIKADKSFNLARAAMEKVS